MRCVTGLYARVNNKISPRSSNSEALQQHRKPLLRLQKGPRASSLNLLITPHLPTPPPIAFLPPAVALLTRSTMNSATKRVTAPSPISAAARGPRATPRRRHSLSPPPPPPPGCYVAPARRSFCATPPLSIRARPCRWSWVRHASKVSVWWGVWAGSAICVGGRRSRRWSTEGNVSVDG